MRGKMERAEKGKEGRKEKKVIGLILAQPRYFTWPLFQNEGRCSVFDMEIIFHSHANKTHLHKKGPRKVVQPRSQGSLLPALRSERCT